MRGGPKGRASSVPARISNSRTALPVSAELKTIPLPSGMNRALTIVCGSNVFIVKRDRRGACGAVARPAKPPAAAAATISSGRQSPCASRDISAATGAARSQPPRPATVALPESASSANATSRADWNRSTTFFSRQ